MSSWRDKLDIKCFDDCRQEGCPKHILELFYHNTSDTFKFSIDGVEHGPFDGSVIDGLSYLNLKRRDPRDF
jgi:hypothetical protein